MTSRCLVCGGSGRCSACKGFGNVWQTAGVNLGGYALCIECGRTGLCHACSGTGKQLAQDVTVQAGRS